MATGFLVRERHRLPLALTDAATSGLEAVAGGVSLRGRGGILAACSSGFVSLLSVPQFPHL